MDRERQQKLNRLLADLQGLLTESVEELVERLAQGIGSAAAGAPGPSFDRLLRQAQDGVRGPQEASYRILGLPTTASWEEVKHRYRELAMRLHPDKAGPETAHLFHLVTLAYEQIRKEKEAHDAKA